VGARRGISASRDHESIHPIKEPERNDAMNDYSLVYPMFAMVVLTFGILVTLFRTRVGFVRGGQVDAKYFKTYQEGTEPEASAKLSRHFANLFEAPVLFYAACLAGLVTGQSSPLLLGLAWLYVVLRGAHAWIHTGRNQLNQRIAAYFSSWLVLLAIWGVIVAGVARSGG
jgi:hypothetical protein